MPPSILHVRTEDVDDAEKRGKYTVTTIGCGEVGVFHALLFAKAGFKVMCVDADQTMVNSLAKGKARFLKREIELELRKYVKTGRLNSTNDIRTATSQSDIVAITIPVKFDEKRKADYSEIESACKHVGSSLQQGSLVIVMSITGVGVTEGVIKEILENTSGFKVGRDFGLAYSPIEAFNGQTMETRMNYQRVVAAMDKSSLNAASTILEVIAKKGVRKIENMKTAEAAVLFEAAQQDVNVALASELALFCEKLGVDYLEAQKLAEAGSCFTLPLPALGYGNIQEEPHLLLEDAENLNIRIQIPKIARETNEETNNHVINLTKDALRSCGKPLRRAKISLLGISQVPNTKSSPKKMAKILAETLEARGAKVSLYDPYFSGDELAEMQHSFSKNLTEALEKVDCILILTGHDQFKRLNLKKLKIMMKMPAAIVDLEGIIEPDKIEKEDFIYRGLGRGVWTR